MSEREEMYQRFLEWRGVETPCPECQGAGSKAYASTATWHGGAGGQMITNGVCDKCWGSGDKDKPWTDLRKLKSTMDGLRRQECSHATGRHDESCDLVAGLQAELDDKNKPLIEALNAIAKRCGRKQWDYAGQVVRDVEALVESDRRHRMMVAELEEELSDWRMERHR